MEAKDVKKILEESLGDVERAREWKNASAEVWMEESAESRPRRAMLRV